MCERPFDWYCSLATQADEHRRYGTGMILNASADAENIVKDRTVSKTNQSLRMACSSFSGQKEATGVPTEYDKQDH